MEYDMIDMTSSFDSYRRVVPIPPRFKTGDRVKLPAALGDAVATVVQWHGPGRWDVSVAGAGRLIVGEEIMRKASPTWRPGDVVVVRFNDFGGGTGYTYVRGVRSWPGENAAAKTDAQMDAYYAAGKLTPVLQAGGVPFDGGRL